MDQVDVSLDKASFVFAVQHEDDAWNWITGMTDEEAVSFKSWGEDSHISTASFKVGSIHVSARVWHDRAGVLRFAPDKEEPCRCEFNPNKVRSEDLRLVMEGSHRVRATRYDVAIDYPGVQLGEWSFRRIGTKGAYFHSRGGEPEGYYLGSLQSSKVFRVYDKMREIIAGARKGERDVMREVLSGVLPTGLARVEVVQRLRPGFRDREATPVLPPELFDGLAVTRAVVPTEGLSPYECGLLALYHHEPTVLACLDKRANKRARELALTRCGEIWPAPRDAFNGAREELLDMAADLRSGLPVRRATIYRECEGAEGSSPGSVSGEAVNHPGASSVSPVTEDVLTVMSAQVV